VNKAWQRYLDAASGLTHMTQQRAERVIKNLVKQGEVAAERAEKAVDELLKRSEQNRDAIAAIVRNETEKAVGRLGLARQRDVERLERKIAQLERQATSGPAKKTTRKTAKKATKKSTKKATKSTRKATESSPESGS
jgi:polyhydroxyalkanoate synthesis regulator phasin